MAFSMPRTKMRSAYLFEDLLEIRTEPVPNRVKTQMHLSLTSAEARLTGAQILKSNSDLNLKYDSEISVWRRW